MAAVPGTKFSIDVTPHEGAWVVRAYRHTILGKRRMSSDWFLNQSQAERFAQELSRELTANGVGAILTRKPGWILHPPVQ